MLKDGCKPLYDEVMQIAWTSFHNGLLFKGRQILYLMTTCHNVADPMWPIAGPYEEYLDSSGASLVSKTLDEDDLECHRIRPTIVDHECERPSYLTFARQALAHDTHDRERPGRWRRGPPDVGQTNGCNVCANSLKKHKDTCGNLYLLNIEIVTFPVKSRTL